MSIVSRTTLKSYFETGDTPTQSQFADLIDSCLNLAASAPQTILGNVTISGGLTVTGTVSAGGFSIANLSTGIVSAASLNVTGTSKLDGAVTFDSTVAGFSTLFNNQVGTSYTLVSSDSGKTITFNNGSSVSAKLPNNLGLGFTCECIQLGAGQVGFFPRSGATLSNRSSQTKIAGQNGAARLTVYSVGAGVSASYNLAGDTA